MKLWCFHNVATLSKIYLRININSVDGYLYFPTKTIIQTWIVAFPQLMIYKNYVTTIKYKNNKHSLLKTNIVNFIHWSNGVWQDWLIYTTTPCLVKCLGIHHQCWA